MERDQSRRPPGLLHQEISGTIIGAFYTAYNELGYGFLEPIYARAMEQLLLELGLRVDREFPIPVYFRGRQIGFHRCDILVNDVVIVEIKATEVLPTSVERQVRNYLRGLRKELGLVLHFGPKPRFIPVAMSRLMNNPSDPFNPEQAIPGPANGF